MARLGVCLLKGGRQMQEKSVRAPPPSTFFPVTLMRGRGHRRGGGREVRH